MKVINTGNDDTDLEQAQLIEQHYLDNHTIGKDVYNLSTSSKTGVLRGSKHPWYGTTVRDRVGDIEYEKIRAKMSESRKGVKNSFYGKKHTIKTLRKLENDPRCKHIGDKNPFYERKHTPETIEQITNSIKDRIIPDDNGKPKPITINGKMYQSRNEAAKDLGISPNTLRRRLQKGYYD